MLCTLNALRRCSNFAGHDQGKVRSPNISVAGCPGGCAGRLATMLYACARGVGKLHTPPRDDSAAAVHVPAHRALEKIGLSTEWPRAISGDISSNQWTSANAGPVRCATFVFMPPDGAVFASCHVSNRAEGAALGGPLMGKMVESHAGPFIRAPIFAGGPDRLTLYSQVI